MTRASGRQSDSSQLLGLQWGLEITEVGTGFLGGADSRESACNAGDLGSISEPGRSPREENGSPLQYSCLENSMDRGAWWVTVHGVVKSQT